ncbi:MAG TPA: VOC family protein [Anaerolineales bacterium]|nr:VOC family protein [Anaerolineales bacterium]
MNVRRIVVDIQSEDFEENRNFYENLIGLELGMDLGWIMTFGSPGNPAAQLTIIRKDLTASVNPTLTIEVENAEAVYANAVEMGFKIVHPLTEEPWGVRRFSVLDPNGEVVNVMSHTKKASGA